jgi:nucleotide-binding universal stress UspA family protein
MPVQARSRPRAEKKRAVAPQGETQASMYSHILVPTDGSRLSEEAAAAAIRLAKIVGARVTAFHVAPEIPPIELEAWARHDEKFVEHLEKAFDRQGHGYVAKVKELAGKAGVACGVHYARAASPAAEIVLAALQRRCDLIFMGSHGMGETADPLLGSVTAKVLAMGKIPVLVHRSRKQ